jgi:signal transduction histidine kinase
MIEQLLARTRSRLGGGLEVKPEPVDLGAPLKNIVDELRTAHPASTIVFDPSPPIVGAWDRDRLEQVFSNLVGNALHHGTKDAPVTVDCRTVGDEAVVRIHNEGPAIPQDVRTRLFDPFRRGARESRTKHTAGLGLGLFISAQIIKAHGGRIEVDSSAERGTTFTVILPRSG